MPKYLFRRTFANFISAIFQAGGLIVVVLEVTRKAFLASLVPVIVNTILGEHQIVADIVAFVSHGDFPRSRLGEKQRGKVLATWVTRKLRTIAQFSIRDIDENPFAADIPQHRMSRSSKPGSIMGNSIRHSTMNRESEGSMPRSPAAVVLEEKFDVPPQNRLPELDTHTDHTGSSTAVPAATSAVPYIQEPQSATHVATDGDRDHFDAGEAAQGGSTSQNRDFRFSFDAVSAPIGSWPHELPSHDAEQPSTGRDALPSQQPSMHGATPGVAVSMSDEKPRPGTQESGLIDDWPQEALMYQSTLGAEDGQYAHRTPSGANAAAQRRYDGSGYDS